MIRILFTRYAVTISFAAIAFFCLPFPLQIRQASTINSISMLISIGLITAALIVMLLARLDKSV